MNKGDIKKVATWDYDVRKFNTVEAILDFAIGREIDAQSFYMKLSSIVKDPKLAKTLTALAAEELDHENELEAIKFGKIALRNQEVGKLNIADYTKDIQPGPDMSYTNLLIIGMKKEETSRALYVKLASIAAKQDLKDTFLKLAQNEAEHKLRFELEYDLMIF